MPRAVSIILGSLLAALLIPSVAGAQTPLPTPTPTPPAPTPAPAPAPAALSIKLERTQRVGRDRVIVRGKKVLVRGTLAPFVAGQRVSVRLFRGSHRVRAKTVAVGPGGAFSASLKAPKGKLNVRASHAATPQQAAANAKKQRLLAIVPHAGLGSRGATVRIVQTRLKTLHYAVARSGVFDASTARAVIAYRKMRGWGRVGYASSDVVRGLLAGKGTFKARFPSHGKHVEADLSRQVLALMNGRKVYRIYTVSSGKASTPTVLGRFKVYSRQLGTNALGMVDSS